MPVLHHTIRSIRTSLHNRSPASIEQVLELVARRAAQVLQARGALVRIINVETQEFAWHAAYGLGEGYVRKMPATNIDLILDLCRNNDVVVVDDVLHDSRVQFPEEAWAEGIRMMLDVPLIVQSPLVGLMRLHFAEKKVLGRVEKNFMISIAEQCAGAIDKAALIDEQRHEYEHLAVQTEKLSALGRMAAGVAHELNNPLAGIMLYGSSLSKKAPEGPMKEGLQLIVEEATRCRDIIQNLLEFSRDREPQKEMTDIVRVMDRSLKVTRNELNLHHIRLERDLPERLPRVHVDANQIEQVFVNLLLNAVEAIEEDGLITVRAYVAPDDPFLVVEIGDDGCGIDAHVLASIFEPFYSTKAKGTGLGLSVSYGIVSKHGGRITVTSKPGEGTSFLVSLPIPAGEGEAPSTAEPPLAGRS
jgi:signal transduction histidine kinase